MASWDEQATCEGKRRFDNPVLARTIADKINRKQKRSVPMEVYRCRVCNLWHISRNGSYHDKRHKKLVRSARRRTRTHKGKTAFWFDKLSRLDAE